MKNKMIYQDESVNGMKIVSDIVRNERDNVDERKFTIEFEVSEWEIKNELKKLSERDEDGDEREISDDVYDEFVKGLSWGYLRDELTRGLIEGISFTLCIEDKMTPNYRVLKEWNKKDSGFYPIHGNLFKLGKLNGLKVQRKMDWLEDEKRKVIKGK
tara:strand:- start:60 stop:530 length:471 start_codon:yes stop_codon:yes gene_type:complete